MSLSSENYSQPWVSFVSVFSCSCPDLIVASPSSLLGFSVFPFCGWQDMLPCVCLFTSPCLSPEAASAHHHLFTLKRIHCLLLTWAPVSFVLSKGNSGPDISPCSIESSV